MKRAAWLLLALLACPARADDAVNAQVQKSYIDPVLDQVSAAARSAADPKSLEPPPLWSPSLDSMSPAARRGVDYAKTKLIDPIMEQTGGGAGQAARALASPDPNAGAGLEEGVFDFPNKLALKLTDLIREAFGAPGSGAGGADAAAPGAGLPADVRARLAPLATPKDFSYRKDSIGLVRGAGSARPAGSPQLGGSSKLKGFSGGKLKRFGN